MPSRTSSSATLAASARRHSSRGHPSFHSGASLRSFESDADRFSCTGADGIGMALASGEGHLQLVDEPSI